MGAPGENGSGFVRENLKYFKDNVISVMAFFAPNKVVDNLKEKINSFKDNKTTYDFGIILNKLLHIDRRTSNNEYNQVCSTFVDSVLKSNGINLTGDIEIPDPGQLYNASKSAPNKIIEIFNDVATKYNGKSIKKKLNTLYNKKYVSIEEEVKNKHIRNAIHIKDRIDIEATIASLSALAKITKDEKKKKELEKTINMYRSMRSLTALEGSINETTLPTGVTLRPATKDDTDNMFKWEMESIDKGIRNDPKVIKYIEKDVQDSIKITKMIMYKDETIGMFTTDKLNDGYWYIGEIYIVKEHRNKGIGTALLKDEISKHDKIKLQVAQSNHGAMKLYKSLGFEITDRNDEGKLYIMTLDKKEKPIKENDFVDYINKAYLSGLKDPADISQYHGVVTESTSVLNEVKRFPIEFDKEGNLIIYKARVGSLAFGDEIDDSVQLLQAYRNASNIEGIKYELAKLWYINDCIEKKLKKRLSNDQYKELIDTRATCLNVFKSNLDYVMKAEKGFNFSDYYNSTPFSDNSTKITANTLKYMVKTVTNVI